MSDDIPVAPSTVTPIISVALDAFGPRGLRLVDVESPQPGKHRIRFDLDGYRLHLITDEEAPNTFALDLRDALHIDEQAHPGTLAAALELINFLHARIHHVRFVLTDADPDALRWDGVESAPPEYLELVPENLEGHREALVSMSFTAPFFDGPPEHWCEVFELGIDVLLYAVGRLHDELHMVGFPVTATARSLA